MSQRLDPERLIRQFGIESPPCPDPLTILTGDETLLINESVDALRAAAAKHGYTERVSLTLDARSDWSSLPAALQSVSLFGDRRIVSLSLPSGRPGRTGGDALQALAAAANAGQLGDVLVVVILPRLDRATQSSKWAKALLSAGTVVEIPQIDRARLPQWIDQRLARQGQHTRHEILEWMADKVEGNLLAAFQEVQKLGLLYPEGELSAEDVEHAVLDVARYNVFGLRDAMLAGQADRMLAMLKGLEAEGEALPLVLWAIGDEVRTLARLAAAQAAGQLAPELRRHRVFGQREQLIRSALNRVPPNVWPAAVQHAHDVDRLIKGLSPAGRLANPWAELARLGLRVAVGGASSPARPAVAHPARTA